MPPQSSVNVYTESCAKYKVKPNCVVADIATTAEGPIKHLNLSRNYCGTENGFAAVLDWIKTLEDLETLDLSNALITTENVSDLVAVLLKHPSVHTVVLHSNRLFVESGVHLVRLARFNPNIKRVDVVDSPGSPNPNHIPERLLRKLNAHLAYNNSHE
jgi:hypothetical protein